jgi:hypothetical protein
VKPLALGALLGVLWLLLGLPLALPGLVRRLLDEEAWREFDAPSPVGHVEHDSFLSFVEAKQPRGLGSRLGPLLALCGDDGELRGRVQRLYDSEIQPLAKPGEVGRGRIRDGGTNSNVTQSNHAEYVVARLKRDDPALAERVVNGEITANAAARQKGWRKPRIVLTSPESIAAALRKHLDADDIAAPTVRRGRWAR